MNKIYYCLTALFLFTTTLVNAQHNRTILTYDVGFGTGDQGDFISPPSWRGFSIEWLKMLDEKMGVGLGLGWNVFYEAKDHDTYTDGTASLSGKQYRYQNQVPMLANFDYYLSPGQKVVPFVGLGTGVMYTRRNTDMNLYTIEQEAWNFTLAPELGIEIDNNMANAFVIKARYNYGFQAGQLDKPQSFISLNVGWAFKS